ncbi:hypothetical protein MMC25_008350 [Agyrium rufum]|nr:hypothetical protein [Agyrium rufum]
MATSIEATPLGNVLVVGGCGFLGSHIVQKLLDDVQCASIAVLHRSPPKALVTGVSYHMGDITDIESVRSLFKTIKPTTIFHTVSPKHDAKAQVLYHTNIAGTRNLLQCATELSTVRALIYASSEQVIYPSAKQQTEDTARLYDEHSVASAYCKSKAIADALVLKANTPTFRTASLRTPGIYGEGDKFKIPILLDGLRKGNHKMQIGNNKKLFEFCYVESAVSAHILTAKALVAEDATADSSKKVAGESFFITDGAPMPFFDFARKVYAIAGDNTPPESIRTVPMWLALTVASFAEWLIYGFSLGKKTLPVTRESISYLDRGCWLSIVKARQRLGYAPVLDQDEAIRRSTEWCLEEERRKNDVGTVRK